MEHERGAQGEELITGGKPPWREIDIDALQLKSTSDTTASCGCIAWAAERGHHLPSCRVVVEWHNPPL